MWHTVVAVVSAANCACSMGGCWCRRQQQPYQRHDGGEEHNANQLGRQLQGRGAWQVAAYCT